MVGLGVTVAGVGRSLAVAVGDGEVGATGALGDADVPAGGSCSAQAASPTATDPATNPRRTARRETGARSSARQRFVTLEGAARVASRGIAALVAGREPFLTLG